MTDVYGTCKKEVCSSDISEEVKELLTAESEEQPPTHTHTHTSMLTKWFSYLKNLLRGKSIKKHF